MNPCQHPIVILKDVRFEDLQTVVQFMYNGVVNVSSEKLPAVLKVSHCKRARFGCQSSNYKGSVPNITLLLENSNEQGWPLYKTRPIVDSSPDY